MTEYEEAKVNWTAANLEYEAAMNTPVQDWNEAARGSGFAAATKYFQAAHNEEAAAYKALIAHHR
jgi:hypothetical protein